MTEEDNSERHLQLLQEHSADVDIVSLVRCLLPVACKGFIVGAGLHVGQVMIGGLASRKLVKE